MRRRWSRPSRLYLAGSAVSALTAGLLLHAYVSRTVATAGTAGPRVPLVLAARAIARGSAVRAADLRAVRMPQAYVPPGAVRSIGEAAGRVALGDLAAGEAVTDTRLARVRAGPVASLIPAGLRAFAVPTSLPRGTVQHGDRVDVLGTFGSAAVGQPHTEVVVSSVEVLFVLSPESPGAFGMRSRTGGVELDAGASGAGTTTTLVLLVSPDQETRLASPGPSPTWRW